MNSTFRFLALASCALGLVSSPALAKDRPDWSNRSQILPKKAHGVEAIAAMGSQANEVARRNGMSRGELESSLRRDHELGVDHAGFLHFVCEGLVVPANAANALTATGNQAYSALPNSTDAFKLHSLPGAQRVIYLDFTGHTTSGTNWNSSFTGGADIVSAPFDTDGSPSTFSASEQDLIKRIWARVAEEYAPFAVDVTTEEPALDALRKTTSSDTSYGVRVVVSPTSAWYPNAGGVAYVGSFSASNDMPCFVFSDKLGPNGEKYVADAIAHEAGHTLGLSHDGKTDGTGYYQGHGDWAPIMGVGYYKAITQWSKGEYALANNLEDDLAVIALNGAPAALDDNGNSLATATQLIGPALFTAGVIENRNDVDLFTFDTGAGSISLSLAGSSTQPNLDAVLELLNASGTVIATANPTTLSASITQTVAAGTYYVRVKPTGYLDPLSTGYSTYGSLGEYVLQGTVLSTGLKTAPTAVASVSATTGTAPLSVTFSSAGSTDADGLIASYSWNFGDGSSSTEANPSHVYSVAGTYAAVLTVVDNDGFATSANALNITVSPAANVLPVAVVTASTLSGNGPLTVNFSSAGSTDSDGTIASYAWTFGDGTTSTLANPTKTYGSVGTFVATLKVTDDRGGSSSKSVTITVTQDVNLDSDVNSLTLTKVTSKSGKSAVATIRVLDRLGRAVQGVTVSAAWTGKVTGTVTGTTDVNGYVVFTSKATKLTGTVTLTVKTVTTPSPYVYNAALYSASLTGSVTL